MVPTRERREGGVRDARVTGGDGGTKRRRDDEDDGEDEVDDDDDNDDDDDETMKRGNVEYVGVRDVDVDALSREYTQRAEETATQMGTHAAEAMSVEERERLTSEVMRYVLFSTHREERR